MKRWILSLLVLLALPAWALDPVGTVIDIQGTVKLTQNQKTAALPLFSQLHHNDELQLETGARLTLTFYRTGAELNYTGPARLLVQASEIRVISGNAPQARTLNDTQRRGQAQLNRPKSGTVLAGLVLRGKPVLTALKPENNTAVLSPTPTFHWRLPSPEATAKLHILDAQRQPVLELTVAGDQLQLPADRPLQPGRRYAWAITPADQGLDDYTPRLEFVVLDEAQRSQVQNGRPAENAPFADWVYYAGMLDSLGLRNEARAIWKHLAAQRPDNLELRALAGDK